MVAMVIDKFKRIAGFGKKNNIQTQVEEVNNITEINILPKDDEKLEVVKQQYRKYLEIMKNETITNVSLSNVEVFELLKNQYAEKKDNNASETDMYEEEEAVV